MAKKEAPFPQPKYLIGDLVIVPVFTIARNTPYGYAQATITIAEIHKDYDYWMYSVEKGTDGQDFKFKYSYKEDDIHPTHKPYYVAPPIIKGIDTPDYEKNQRG
jgi:hypothetical protein